MSQIVSVDRKVYIITVPTSGTGRATALKMVKHGTLVLIGRNSGKLNGVMKGIERLGGQAVAIVCDMSDLASVRRAAAQIIALDLPIVGLLNNAGVQNPSVVKNAASWDMTFVTNHLGPFALTDALVPHWRMLRTSSSSARPSKILSGVPPNGSAFAAAAPSPPRRAHTANGNPLAPIGRASTPMPRLR